MQLTQEKYYNETGLHALLYWSYSVTYIHVYNAGIALQSQTLIRFPELEIMVC